MDNRHHFHRRDFLRLLMGLGCLPLHESLAAMPSSNEIIKKAIPSTGEALAVIGMGSWLTFDIDEYQVNYENELETRVEILRTFFRHGGALIDSSPMYGNAEAVIGHALANIERKQALFSATKVWIQGRWMGEKQMEQSRRLWGVKNFDLMQIHNMLDWHTHLETLKDWKREGRIRYLGVTTSHGRRHGELEKALRHEPFDFVQFTYNIRDREAERRLLPLAAERGMAVIANRPFQGGDLFKLVRGKGLPPWAAEIDCHNWAQFFLKFIVSHPAVTCAIPATSQVAHMRENMGACYGRLPDEKTRRKMIAHLAS